MAVEPLLLWTLLVLSAAGTDPVNAPVWRSAAGQERGEPVLATDGVNTMVAWIDRTDRSTAPGPAELAVVQLDPDLQPLSRPLRLPMQGDPLGWSSVQVLSCGEQWLLVVGDRGGPPLPLRVFRLAAAPGALSI